MIISIGWGTVNKLRVELTPQEVEHASWHAAKEVVSMCDKHCEEKGVDQIQFSVDMNPTLRSLFDNHLSNMKFGLVELKEEKEGPVVEELLIYKQKGWTLGPQTGQSV